MKTLILYSVEDDDLGEAQGMFLEDGTLLGAWLRDDADWRSEYLDPFMQKLDFKIRAPKKDERTKLLQLMKDHFGC